MARHAAGLGRHRSARHGTKARPAPPSTIESPAAEQADLTVWLPRREAAARAGVHLNTIRNWEQEGRLPVRQRHGSREMVVDAEALDRIVAERGSGRLPRRGRTRSTTVRPASADFEMAIEPARGAGRDVYATQLSFDGDAEAAFAHARVIVLADALSSCGLSSDLIEDLDEGQIDRPGPLHIRWRSLRNNGDVAWILVSHRPHEREHDLRWRLEARVVAEEKRCWASLRLTLQPLGPRMAPVQLAAGAPKTVELLLRGLEVRADNRRLSTEPTIVRDDGVGALVELLVDPERILPVVICSRERATNRHLVDPATVAHALAGLGHVFAFDTADTSFALTQHLGDKRSVFQGAIRLYWPGFTVAADPWSHPLYLPERITLESRSHGGFERFLLGQIVPVAAMRLPVSEVERRAQRQEVDARRSEQTAVRERAAVALDVEWQEELERAWAEEERLRAYVAELEERLSRTEIELQDALTRSVGPPEEEDAPTSMGEAVERVAKSALHLEFLPEAFASAWSSPYAQPEKIMRALLALDEVAGAYQAGEMGRGIKAECEARGLPYRSDTSKTARGKYGHEYRRTYNGQTIMLGPHLAFGAGPPRTCARVYFYIDEDERRFVIGHVGSHLRDTRTG